MAEYDYVAIDPAGKDRKGSIKADSIEEARAKLDARKLFIVALEPGAVESARSRANLSLRSPRLSAKELTLFTRQLATLTQVSPLEESLRTIGRQSEQDHVRAVVGKVHSGVMEGRRLADALGAEPKSFPPLYRAMISAGESSGSLPTIMERLSDLMERQALMRSKVLTAIAYPSVLATFAVFVVAALMIFVVPKVVEQFDTVGQELPLLTRMVMGLSAFLAAYWWLLLIAMILGGVAFWRALKNERFRYRFDATLLGLPVLGKLIRDLHAARMARTLSTMVASRLPLMEGLTLTANTVHNRVLRRASDEIVEAI
ncbi:type II secretion system F family protein, partial [Sphingobium sp. ba1]|uniref:type II secretion system F family protein n=1 Tax=Sphingobium sp. ba1 TaxID=1522072 RepID=UPI0009E021E9